MPVSPEGRSRVETETGPREATGGESSLRQLNLGGREFLLQSPPTGAFGRGTPRGCDFCLGKGLRPEGVGTVCSGDMEAEFATCGP